MSSSLPLNVHRTLARSLPIREPAKSLPWMITMGNYDPRCTCFITWAARRIAREDEVEEEVPMVMKRFTPKPDKGGNVISLCICVE